MHAQLKSSVVTSFVQGLITLVTVYKYYMVLFIRDVLVFGSFWALAVTWFVCARASMCLCVCVYSIEYEYCTYGHGITGPRTPSVLEQ